MEEKIELTEENLKKIIKESVIKILKEVDDNKNDNENDFKSKISKINDDYLFKNLDDAYEKYLKNQNNKNKKKKAGK